MTCRDFIYWLHGAFELSDYFSIHSSNYDIVLEHIKLAKKNQDEFFEHVCYIEGLLSLWDSSYDAHQGRLNSKVKEYLNSIFTKVTSSERTLEGYVDQGIIKVEHQTYDIDCCDEEVNCKEPEPILFKHGLRSIYENKSRSVKRGSPSMYGPRFRLFDTVRDELEKSNRPNIVDDWVVNDEEERECTKINPFDLDEEESEMSQFQISGERARKRIAEWPQWKRDIMEAEDKLREKRRQEDLEDDGFYFGRGY